MSHISNNMTAPFSFNTFPIFMLLIIIPLFLFFHQVIAQHNLIQQTCRNCSENDPNISYKFCVGSLQAAPKSHCVHSLRELGFISIKLVLHNVTDTELHIMELLKKKKIDPYVKSVLNDCLKVYSDATATVREVIKDYKGKRYDDANIELSSVLDASTTCEDGFKDKEGVVSPLTKRNNHVFQLSAISLSIINMLRETSMM